MILVYVRIKVRRMMTVSILLLGLGARALAAMSPLL